MTKMTKMIKQLMMGLAVVASLTVLVAESTAEACEAEAVTSDGMSAPCETNTVYIYDFYYDFHDDYDFDFDFHYDSSFDYDFDNDYDYDFDDYDFDDDDYDYDDYDYDLDFDIYF